MGTTWPLALLLALAFAAPGVAAEERRPETPDGAPALRMSFRDAPLDEVFRRLEHESGIRILRSGALAEERVTVSLDESDLEQAVRKVLRAASRAAGEGLVVFYEQGQPTPKMILIFDAPRTTAPEPRGAPPTDEVRTLPYVAPPEPPRYVPPAREPETVPVEQQPREIPTRVPARDAR